jgi:hypothetical protein
MQKYFGHWAGQKPTDIADDFQYAGTDFPTAKEIIFASYATDNDGDAFVVYKRKNLLYEVNGSHCSCFGLEGQWSPEVTSKMALGLRQLNGMHDTDAVNAFKKLFPTPKIRPASK